MNTVFNLTPQERHEARLAITAALLAGRHHSSEENDLPAFFRGERLSDKTTGKMRTIWSSPVVDLAEKFVDELDKWYEIDVDGAADAAADAAYAAGEIAEQNQHEHA